MIGNEVIVTGEWCLGVMGDHGIANSFRGRGVQYHLGMTRILYIFTGHIDIDIRCINYMFLYTTHAVGFHQASGKCRGHVPVTDSHFLQASLGHRILGAYYLGTISQLHLHLLLFKFEHLLSNFLQDVL